MGDEQLMPDRAAFELQFNTHLHAIMRYAQRRLAGSDAVWDVVAETFTVAWRRRTAGPTNQDEVLPWLYAIAANVVRNTRRAQLRRGQVARRFFLIAQVATDGHQEIDARLDAARRLSGALAQLPEDDQEILRLVAWEDLSLAEVAGALGISYGAAKVRLHRARGRLRQLLPTDTSSGGLVPGRPPEAPIGPVTTPGSTRGGPT